MLGRRYNANFVNPVSYVASKHAVAGITKAVALDCAPFRVHCNAVCPGCESYLFSLFIFITAALFNLPTNVKIDTQTAMTAPMWAKGQREHLEPLHPFRGLGTPEDIARAVLFLASEDNSWMTGVIMPVDGGYVAQ
jgi:NAD(P)-dependent dehydrogenase (short-subunit alcohol dehydrogenase family)